jgi:hypothetical protein
MAILFVTKSKQITAAKTAACKIKTFQFSLILFFKSIFFIIVVKYATEITVQKQARRGSIETLIRRY